MDLSRLTNTQQLAMKDSSREVNFKILKDKKPVDVVTGSKSYRDWKGDDALAMNCGTQVSEETSGTKLIMVDLEEGK